ncbi:hypothetical protein NF700_01255 [Sphingomonadaceae bacterium OTU29MARTA1]|nr:hypothetical protein NF700_01255 [Sphingomonadaceae bacterium OTU29MARTA1]
MTDRPADAAPPATLADLPIQPTGSGVADLEVAYEQMTLAADDADFRADKQDGEAAAEAAAHPS